MPESAIQELKLHISKSVDQAVKEHVTKMQESSGQSVSRLFFDFKTEMAERMTRIEVLGQEMIKHQKETNGRVNRHDKLFKEHNHALIEVEGGLKAEITAMKDEKKHERWKQIARWTVGSHILMMAVYIKESRDIMIDLFKRLFL